MSNYPSLPLITVCDGQRIKRLFAAGLAWFERHYGMINDLNVFPVPDGDTGTNMLLTLRAAYRRIAEQSTTNAGAILRAIATGALYGSKGNSGTLLSEMFNGFARAVGEAEALDAPTMIRGLREAVKLSYAALDKPVEGTILTVAREISEVAESHAQLQDLRELLALIIVEGMRSVNRTPDLLPLLKAAGVVDSGGRGLILFFEGMMRYAQGEDLVPTFGDISSGNDHTKRATGNLHQVLQADDERGYPYDVQYILRGDRLNLTTIRKDISAMGDSMVVTENEGVIKVHIHVYDPGVPISYGVSLGMISEVVVENMQEQFDTFVPDNHSEKPSSTDEQDIPVVSVTMGDIAAIAVAPGVGFEHVLAQLGAAGLISGGPSMNPSVDDFIQTMRRIPTDKFVLLPNDKNVILTARQAAKLIKEEGKTAEVIPTTTTPQGISAILMGFSPLGELGSVANAMRDGMTQIVTGEITRASRDVSNLEGVTVVEGQWIGLVDGHLVAANDDERSLILDVLEKMDVTEHELITVYYGAEVSSGEAERLVTWLRKQYEDQPSFEAIAGGQPNYPYILSAE